MKNTRIMRFYDAFRALGAMVLALVAMMSVAQKAYAQSRMDTIQWVIMYQLRECPESQLRDIYKNFMQDNYGPGHILKDTKAARAYLDSELAETTEYGGPLYEKTGYKGNFYRVNLSLIKDGIVPEDKYFDAFVRSVKGIRPPAIEDWKNEWKLIEEAYEDLGITLENEEQDREEINDKLQSGNFVMHHSDAFNKASRFHYRIMSRKIFETEILPLLTPQPTAH